MQDYRRVIKVKCKHTKKPIFIKEDRFNPDHHKLIKEAPAPVSLNSFTRNLEEQKSQRAKYSKPEALIAAQKNIEQAAAENGEITSKVDMPINTDVKSRTNQEGKVKGEDEEATQIAQQSMQDPMPTNLLKARQWAKRKGMEISNKTTMDEVRTFAEERGLL